MAAGGARPPAAVDPPRRKNGPACSLAAVAARAALAAGASVLAARRPCSRPAARFAARTRAFAAARGALGPGRGTCGCASPSEQCQNGRNECSTSHDQVSCNRRPIGRRGCVKSIFRRQRGGGAEGARTLRSLEATGAWASRWWHVQPALGCGTARPPGGAHRTNAQCARQDLRSASAAAARALSGRAPLALPSTQRPCRRAGAADARTWSSVQQPRPPRPGPSARPRPSTSSTSLRTKRFGSPCRARTAHRAQRGSRDPLPKRCPMRPTRIPEMPSRCSTCRKAAAHDVDSMGSNRVGLDPRHSGPPRSRSKRTILRGRPVLDSQPHTRPRTGCRPGLRGPRACRTSATPSTATIAHRARCWSWNRNQSWIGCTAR